MKKFINRIVSAFLILILAVSLLPTQVLAASADSSAGVVTVSGSLNVRSSASTSSTILSSLTNGRYITLLARSGDWWKVEYSAGRYGYCSAAYINPVSGTYTAYSTASLNVRSGPGIEYGIISWVNNGQYVVVLSASGSWKKVLFNGTRIGYVSGAYLSSGSSSSSSYSAASLTVPSYKQTDSRWAYAEVGTSGSTIGTIGCSTTCIAMSESYRTGTTIYPNEMENRLNYTAGGSIYWPSNYSAYTGSDYLKVTYDLLRSGKPTLVGLKTLGGSQHWVVVTGFTGGSSLSASSFTVNDPGSNSRTTLQQVINSYPYFYKLMHY